jgi:amino acid transporter
MADDDSRTLTGTRRDDERQVIRLPRQRTNEDPEQPSVRQGGKPGERIVRLMRPSERRFQSEEPGTLRATDVATQPRTKAERAWRSMRRVLLGAPLSTEVQEEQRLPKIKALAVFSSDALSSSAYATDEILIVLAAAGAGALAFSIPIALVIAGLLGVVAFSYRQTIKAYPNGGGAYIVARENLGELAGLTAAASLAVDYVLTVAVSIAAGVLAITSAFPEVAGLKIEIALACVLFITVANLRGLKESGTIFAIPTYGFIVSFLVLIAVGLVRVLVDPGLKAEPPETTHALGASAVTIFLLLRAFASGCTALTGIEAISNGIPAFKKPESTNASITLLWMAAILTTLFLGITVLAHQLDVMPSDDVSVAAQIGMTVLGADSPLFYVVQAFTALILILAANTSYADFPRLGSILARDRFLPHQFTFRGDRLAFSNGIIVLGVAASGLLLIYDANVTKLIPLYAFGVFVSFTLSQGGMVQHWLRLREPGWRLSMIVNGFGALTTAIVAIIIGATKFSHGAWISMVAMAILALLFWTVRRHYVAVERRLQLPAGMAPMMMSRQNSKTMIVPVDEVNLAALKAIGYARSMSPNVIALHVTDDVEVGERLRRQWEAQVLDVPLLLISSPYRSFVVPIISYLDALQSSEPDSNVTVVLPEYRTTFPWQGWLHNQTSRRLRSALLDRPNTVVIDVPYHLGEPLA